MKNIFYTFNVWKTFDSSNSINEIIKAYLCTSLGGLASNNCDVCFLCSFEAMDSSFISQMNPSEKIRAFSRK